MPARWATSRELPADPSACDREPIHAPGAIQPHGILFTLSPGTFNLVAVSANAGACCDAAAGDLLGLPISQVIDPASFAQVAAARLTPGQSLRMAHLQLAGQPAHAWRAIMHAADTAILIEAEKLPPNHDAGGPDRLDMFQNAVLRVQTADDAAATSQRLAEEVRFLTGYARVLVYRLAPNCSGEVIAESSDDTLASFSGLHFPASDIPLQARSLYRRNTQRQIPDVDYTSVPLLQLPGPAIDLGPVGLRSISPMHIAYLRNMAVGAALSISILHNGALWGLVICHHPVPRYAAPELRQSSVLLAQVAIARIALIEEAQAAHRRVAVKAAEAALMQEASRGGDSRDALLRNSNSLLALLGASGMVFSSGGAVTTLGEAPTGPALSDLLAWLAGRGGGLLAIDDLPAQYPAADRVPMVAGLLALPLGGPPQNLLVWLRPETARVVSWAGDPVKPMAVAGGPSRLAPRRSFQPWPVEVRGTSQPWTAFDIAAADSLRDTICEVVVRGSLDVMRINAQLVRSNRELEAFSYIASHDLKEPLRQIEVVGTLLQRAFGRGDVATEKVERWFDAMLGSCRRLRGLIDDLASFARLGGEAKPFAPANLDTMLQAVLRDLHGLTQAAGATVTAETLPTSIMCDATQIRQLLQNLLANALKFRHPERPPVIRVRARLQTAGTALPDDLPLLELRIEDNGIGFESRHSERIFEPFERLNGAEQYDGSGLGLAICRKVVERHGGTITASGRPGEGAVFVATIPLRPLPGRESGAP